MRTAGQLATTIKKLVQMDIAELGEGDSEQNTYIFDYLSRALQELASIAFVVRTSDQQTISTDGYITFNLAGSPIDDLYEPLRIVDSSGNPVVKRTYFEAPKGWYRESSNSDIHVKGLNGTYTLYYKAYPKEIITAEQVPEFPPSGYLGLCYYTCGLIKESKDFYEESQAMYTKAKERLKIAVKANVDARGVQGGSVPNVNDIDVYFKG